MIYWDVNVRGEEEMRIGSCMAVAEGLVCGVWKSPGGKEDMEKKRGKGEKSRR